MKNKIELNIIALFILMTVILACGNSEKTADNSEIFSSNSENSEKTPELRSFSAENLISYLKANQTELGNMLTNKEIEIYGEVWKGGSLGGGSGSFEFWTKDGRVSCNGNNMDAAKLGILEKAASDYLYKRTSKMPFVKAKGVYKTGFAPTAPPNNYWSAVMENCSISDVVP